MLKGIGNAVKNWIYDRKLKFRLRYRGGVFQAASDGRDMDEYYYWIRDWSRLKVRNIVEIGANYGQDSERLRILFGLKKKDIYIFEAHPRIAKTARKIFGFHTYQNAVFNEEKKIVLHGVDELCENSGISTVMHSDNLQDKLTKNFRVQAIRMDMWMQKNNLNHIDFCKIDAEGANYEVLQGFGEKLHHVNAIQIEAEHEADYDGEHLWEDISRLLEETGFVLVLFIRHTIQSDSLWIRKDFMYKPGEWKRYRK